MNRSKNFLIYLLSIAFSLSVLYWQYGMHYNNLKDNLISFSKVAQAAINPDRVQSVLSNLSDDNNQDLIRLQEQVAHMAEAGRDIRYVYLMARGPDGLFFIADAQPSVISGIPTDPANLATFGEIYSSNDPEILNVAYGRQSMTFSVGSDKWGSFVSTALPIRSRDGTKILAIVGVDMDQKVWNQSIFTSMISIIILITIFNSMSLLIFLSYQKKDQNKSHLLYLASILDSSHDAIISLDFDGIIKTWNKGAEKMFGYTSSEAVGQNIRILALDDKHWEADNYLSQAKIGKSLFIPQTNRIKKDKTLIIVSLTSSPIINDNGDIIGVSIIDQDNTETSKQIQDLITKNQELEKKNNSLINHQLEIIKIKSKAK